MPFHGNTISALGSAYTESTNSQTIDLSNAKNASVQLDWTVNTPVGCSVITKKSNDGVTWFDLGTSTSITANGSEMRDFTDIGYKYVRVELTVGTGTVTLSATFFLKDEV